MDVPKGKSRNPPWTRDELILALDLYFRMDFIHNKSLQHPEIKKLSMLLNQLQIYGDRCDPARFRNSNGVYMKLGNFLHLDPDYKGIGLTRGSKLDEEVWNEFAKNRDKLKKLASELRSKHEGAIRQGNDEGEAIHIAASASKPFDDSISQLVSEDIGTCIGVMMYRDWAADGKHVYQGALLVLEANGSPVELHHTDRVEISKLHKTLFGKQFNSEFLGRKLLLPLYARAKRKPTCCIVRQEELLDTRWALPVAVARLMECNGGIAFSFQPEFMQDHELVARETQKMSTESLTLELFQRLEDALQLLDKSKPVSP